MSSSTWSNNSIPARPNPEPSIYTPPSTKPSSTIKPNDTDDEVYVQLDASTQNAKALAAEGHRRGKLEHEGGLVERDAMVFQAAKRIAQLDAAHEGLVFGRLDLDASIDQQPRYIGRIGVRNAERDVLLIDWRAIGRASCRERV